MCQKRLSLTSATRARMAMPKKLQKNVEVIVYPHRAKDGNQKPILMGLNSFDLRRLFQTLILMMMKSFDLQYYFAL